MLVDVCIDVFDEGGTADEDFANATLEEGGGGSFFN